MSTANEIKALKRRIDAARNRGNFKAAEEMARELNRLQASKLKIKKNTRII
tara:strand:- start:39 stop:191 length:153 start_codon:yes stop_codon:yes gene_type:complete